MGKVVGLAIALLALAGCKSDGGDDNTAGVGGAGGMLGGAGVSGGAGASGAAAGAGGAGGTGMAGAGAAGMGGGNTFAGCAVADTSAAPSALHAAAAAVLTMASPCGFGSCHAGQGKAGLILLSATDLRMTLVDKASCQAPTIPLVDDAGGDAGLVHSWLWLKLTAPADTSGVVTGDAAWGAGVNCGQTGGQMFGLRMPWTNTDMPLEEARLAAIRNWICAGAPGP